ncbi:Baculoviral IAP repeat-containing protein 6 [Grifola frondosa]|uniref:Baculoviral IAP repeat-containing protein 6 n=1 Tax=Grifola frondosa TaxID=5627 RepID=A0A1C7LZW6_GRIFR|nr:Baculoviral IAP repeat-containing protein 6 [Grifola frondosa]
MDREVQQLVEMGATVAQARAALKQYKDVMEAADRIFDGSFDHVVDEDGDAEMTSADRVEDKQKARLITPDDEDEDIEGAEEDDDGKFTYAFLILLAERDSEDEYVDYDSDYGHNAEPRKARLKHRSIRRHFLLQGQTRRSHRSGRRARGLDCSWDKRAGSPHDTSLYRELSEGRCSCPHGCGTSIARKKSDFFSLFSSFSAYIKHLQEIVTQKCRVCSKTYCFACGESSTVERKRQTSPPEQDESLFHCSNLQGIILGVGLAMLEKTFIDETQDSGEGKGHGQPASRTNKRRKVVPEPVPFDMDEDDEDEEDEDYRLPVPGRKPKVGTGYAGNIKEDTSGQVEAQAIQHEKDQKLATLLSNIRVFLPAINRPGGSRTSDYLVHPTTLAHLRRRFNFVSSQLLRNDSLTDMSDRSVLYFELFEWLETISSHEALASMMAMPIMVVTSVKAVVAKKPSSRGAPRIRERTIVYEGSSGPRELLEAIVIQATAALKGLEGVKQPAQQVEEMSEEQKRMTTDDKGKARDTGPTMSEENSKLLNFCLRIVNTAKAIDRSLREMKGDAFVERLHAGLPKIPMSTNQEDSIRVEAGDTEESARKAYMEWANRVRFEYCDLTIPPSKGSPPVADDDQTPHFKFYYNNEARMLANADIPKRSLAIAKELAVLTTNLPVAWDSSVFLRVDETRVDVIKALITGPEGTPYYNGCYLFDVFLGPNYNHSPPSVKYMTTNGGKFRFNPNLYADGKVCLSLLGTWQGPGWISGKSTLLQVLISIQSMILCEEPYLNEPGWASSGGTPQSRAYSANVRRMVVKTAMLGNLKAPPEPWGDVIRTHFRLKARSIIVQLDKWLEEDDGKATTGDGAYTQKSVASGSSNGFRADVDELKTLLTRLQSGDSIDTSS